MERVSSDGERFLAGWIEPGRFLDLDPDGQDLFLRMARRAGLLARFAHRLEDAGLTAQLSPKVREHLLAAKVVAAEDARMMLWETDRIQRAFFGSDLELVLLKGAAYLANGLPMAQGRLVADVDILCAKKDLAAVEERLLAQGWQQVKMDPYDQSYYRDWMHELPPMRHKSRLTELDVHHAILPTSGRLQPDSNLLLADKVAVDGEKNLFTLAPVDMVLHGVVHLFYDSDFDKGLRGLADLDGLFRHFGQQPEFWQTLIPRARQLNLARPLYYGLRMGEKILSTPIPKSAQEAIKDDAPAPAIGWLMEGLIKRMMVPNHPETKDLVSWFAWLLLFIRSHWLRMPPGLLFSHLTQKWVRKWRVDVRNRRTV